MDSETISNPYRQNVGDNYWLAPFAGRKTAFARLHQQLADTTTNEAVAYVGRRHIGKTALLRHFDTVFDDTYVGIYIPMAQTPVDNEADWLLALAQAATAVIVERGFTLSRLADIEPPAADHRAWLSNVFMPEIFGVIRHHRRLVFLLDDAERLLEAITSGRLPGDSFAYLHSLLDQYPQLGFALTVDASREGDLAHMSPLVRLTGVYRLTNLSADETAWLLQEPVTGIYTVPNETAAAVQRATGGTPVLVQLFGDAFFKRWEVLPELNVMTVDDVKAVTPSVNSRADGMLRELWTGFTVNEQLVLSAVSSLAYSDPLGKIDTPTIESWLVETDYPMDATGVNAALRSLEYHEILSLTGGKVTINAGLIQSWLIENARLTTPVQTAPPEPAPPKSRRVQVLVIALIVLIIGLIVVISLTSAPETRTAAPAAPTVTLVGND
jgi:hypothetical protein